MATAKRYIDIIYKPYLPSLILGFNLLLNKKSDCLRRTQVHCRNTCSWFVPEGFTDSLLHSSSVPPFICSFMLPVLHLQSLSALPLFIRLCPPPSLPRSAFFPPPQLSAGGPHLISCSFHSHRSVLWQTESRGFYTVKAAPWSQPFNKLPHLSQLYQIT